LHLFLVKETVSLDELFSSAKSKLEVVVIFLAILELIRLREIVAVQKVLFGQISIARRQNILTCP
jgi:segregation and condensation protein A